MAESIRREDIDVLVLGGGASGSAAAWQAARLGARVLVAEPTPWLGGMITAAGVSAFDGNKGTLATGFYRLLRNHLEDVYGGPEKTFTGWISHTCFEPHVAARWIRRMVTEAGARVLFDTELVAIHREGNRVTGARLRRHGQLIDAYARVTIEATEYGDALELGGVPYRLGRDARAEFGEPHAPEQHDMEVQDLTLCAILQKFPGRAPAVPRPEGYDPTVFDGCLAQYSTIQDPKLINHALHTWESFITYAALPNDKYLLNWPFHSNDSPDTNGVFGTAAERAEALRRARHRTLCFVHFMQNELGHPEWGLAMDEFATPDGLAFIPYVREARRVRGITAMIERDVLPADGCVRPPFQPDSIAVGDYFLDHHHSKMHQLPEVRLHEEYPDNAPFQVPFGTMIPESVDGLVVAEKSISVSHIVNGCTRLQPCVMLIGQAAGVAAAIAAATNIEPRRIGAHVVQNHLMKERVMLYVYQDLDHMHPAFAAVQRVAMRGVMPDADPYLFRPDEAMTEAEVAALKPAGKLGTEQYRAVWRAGMSRAEYFEALDGVMG